MGAVRGSPRGSAIATKRLKPPRKHLGPERAQELEAVYSGFQLPIQRSESPIGSQNRPIGARIDDRTPR
jgi:hypothetical protein